LVPSYITPKNRSLEQTQFTTSKLYANLPIKTEQVTQDIERTVGPGKKDTYLYLVKKIQVMAM